MINQVTIDVVDCDARDCMATFAGDDGETEDEVRAHARAAGWVHDGGDLCPLHTHLADPAGVASEAKP